ncbi:MAG: hypothetical protein KKE50_02000, partial [Nanoarchaeota archaeon]|nr:hypothetical protein [Nanoarchaeota archaeon]
NAQFTAGYTKEYSVKHRVTFTIGSTYHSMGVVSLTPTTATINVSSTPQQKTLSIGDEWKVEVSGDNLYDLSVKLNSIANNKANITLQPINESISAAPSTPATPSEPETTPAPEEQVEKSIFSTLWFWVLLLAIIIIIVILVFLLKNKKRYSRKGY